MAHILPNAPVRATTPEVMRIYQLLRRLPDDEYYVWQRLHIWEQPGPDFWLLRQDRRALLLKVADATPGQVQAALQPALFGPTGVGDRARPAAAAGKREEEALAQFREQLAEPEAAAIPAAVLFPNLTQAALRKLPAGERPAGAQWLSKEELAPNRFGAWLAEHLSAPLSKSALAALRSAFTPEVVIPAAFTVREPIERHTGAELTSYLLDYRQEHLLKTDLELPEEAQATARAFGIRLVNGVAGSGKSLIIVYRAHLLRQLFPKKRILALTHNRPLIRDLKARYRQLSGGERGVQWYTFYGWCRRTWPRDVPWLRTAGQQRRQQLFRRAWHEHLADTAVSAQMLQEETDWFKDRLLFGREDYLSADRAGRGFALAESMRQRVYDAMEAYHEALSGQGVCDWGDVPRRMWRLLQAGQVRCPAYDVILVDEAQFFAPIWLEIVKLILKPRTGYLFLVADPTQGFLKRGQSWLASGLEVRGRSHRLNKSYRTTREILDFATLLYRTRLPDDEEGEEIVAPNLLDMPSGALPVVIPLTSPQDEVTRVLNEIRELVGAGVEKGHILVIHADWRETGKLLGRLRQTFGGEAAVDPGQADECGGKIRVCSLQAATGLEAPIVFLMGVHALYEEEQSVRLSEGERAELMRDNTRKLYMACTRAGQRLVLTYVGEVPELLRGLVPETGVALG
jgi:hypothetical protein